MEASATRGAQAPQSTTTPPLERHQPVSRSEQREPLDGLVRGLGWFSVGLGAAELLAPEAVARLVGIRKVGNPTTIRLLGLRELAAGIGILTTSNPAPWMWARVAGDAMDLAILGVSDDDNVDRGRTIASAVVIAGVMALDIYGSRQAARSGGGSATRAPGKIEVRKTVTIGRSSSEIYDFWRNLENLPRFMEHLDSVRVLDGRRSHWKARGPAGAQYEWHAEITDDRPGELIAWRSLSPADAFNTGIVRFLPAPRDQGTEVHVELRYDPPAGALGALIAKLFGEEPGQQVLSDLRRLKQVLETGEAIHSDARVARGRHPARPNARKGATS